MDSSNIQAAQDELKRSIERIKSTHEQDIQNMKSKYSGSMVNNIIKDVGTALDNSTDEIVSMIMSKSGREEALINEIVRSALISSLERHIGEANDNIIMDFSESVKGLDTILKNMDIDLNYTDKIITGLQDLFKSIPLLNDSSDSTSSKPLNGLLGGITAGGLSTLLTGSIGTTITTATAVIGTVINPILGIIVAGLPLLLSLFGQKSQNDNAESQVRTKLLGEVFPQIKGKLRTELPAILQEQLGKMIAQVQAQYQQVLQSQQAEFDKAMQEKKDSEEANKQKKDLFVNFRSEVQNIMEQIAGWRIA